MIIKTILPLATVFGAIMFSASAPGKTIICLTYDDGLDSHLQTVVPQLDSAGLKATFFLNAIAGASNTLGGAAPAVQGWSKAAQNGHELGNHTLFHACPEKFGWQPAYATEKYTIARLITEIEGQATILSLIDPARKKRSYAYPCNNFMIEGQDYSSIIKNKGLVQYGRAGGDRNSVVPDYKVLKDLMKVPSWLVEEGTTLEQLIAFAEKVKGKPGMAVYQFHGIGGQFFKVSADVHREFLKYLKQHSDEYWVAGFSEAMDYVRM